MGWGSGGSESNSEVGWCSETCIWRMGGGEIAWRWCAAAKQGKDGNDAYQSGQEDGVADKMQGKRVLL
jgi:hypothetical protein